MKAVLLIMTSLIFFCVKAQKPSGVPTDTGTVSLDSLSDVIIYIILPAVAIALYLLWRRKKKQEDAEKNKNKKHND